MKKIFTLLLCLSMSSLMFAGGYGRSQKKCKWYSKRYKSLARISIGVPLCLQSNSSCNGNIRGYSNPSCTKGCGFQEAWSGPYGSGAYGYIKSNECSRGEILNPLSLQMLPSVPAPEDVDDFIEESSISADAIEFIDDENVVALSNFSGSMDFNKGHGFYSDLKVIVWVPEHDTIIGDEDTLIDPLEIIDYLTIRVTDNGVSVFGGLNNSAFSNAFSYDESNDFVRFNYNIDNFIIDIPPHISMDDVVIHIEGDAGPDDGGNGDMMQRLTNKAIESNEINFNVFPNPSQQLINIEFVNNMENASSTIIVYDQQGKEVAILLENKVLNIGDQVKLNKDISEFPSGNYYILIQSGEQKYLKQFIKN